MAFLALVTALAAQIVPRASLGHSGGLNPVARTLNIDTVRAMLDAGEDPNMRDPDSGATLLHYAILYNRPELAELLVDHKANVNARIDKRGPETGATPLLYAVVRDELAVVKLLVANGADLHATYRSGRTALHLAANGGMADIARLLLQFGGDPNARDIAGSSPLDEAVWKGSPEVASLLLESGAQINAPQPRTGATPLNEAACKGQNAMVQLLLAHGADAVIEDKAGFSPLGTAIRCRHADTARLLFEHSKSDLKKALQSKSSGASDRKRQRGSSKHASRKRYRGECLSAFGVDCTWSGRRQRSGRHR